MNPSLATNIGLLISVAIVLATLAGEFRDRAVRARTLWIRPATLAILTFVLGALSLKLAPHLAALLFAYVTAGAAIGALMGWFIARYSSVSPGGNLTSLQVRGSAITVAIWVAFLAARIALRTVTPSLPILGLDSSVAASAAIAAAFFVIALSHRSALLQRVTKPADRFPAAAAGLS